MSERTWRPELSDEEAHDRIAAGDLGEVREIAHVLVNERRYLMEEMFDGGPESENPSRVDPEVVLRFEVQSLRESNAELRRRISRAISTLLFPPYTAEERRRKALDHLGYRPPAGLERGDGQ
jgi:hypothetical protein